MKKESEHSYYNTVYRSDTSSWSRRRFEAPKKVPAKLDPVQLSETRPVIRRCLRSIEKGECFAHTPDSTTHSTFSCKVPMERSSGPTVSKRIPLSAPPPPAPDATLLRPSTEYRSRFVPVHSDPFLSQSCTEFVNRTREVNKISGISKEARPPVWNSTYRCRHGSLASARASSSDPITFHSYTNLR